MRKYKIQTKWLEGKIVEVEVERETDSSVWVNGSRSAKKTEYYMYFDTWGEAHRVLTELATARVSSCKVMLDKSKGVLGNIKGMKKERKCSTKQ